MELLKTSIDRLNLILKINHCLKPWHYVLFFFAFVILVLGYWIFRPMNFRKGGIVEIRKENGKFILYKNGSPFFVKGGAGFTHMEELAAIGGNTIRTWDTTNLGMILDEAKAHHLNVIAGFFIPESTAIKDFYNDSSKTGAMVRAYIDIVNRYKNHDALLAWCVGNELAFTLNPNQSPFYSTMKTLLKGIREADKNHPITTTIIERKNILGIKLRLPYFDFISVNTFANIKQLKKQILDISLLWNGPYLITEWSPIGGWEAPTTAWQSSIENTSTKTAELVYQYYKQYMPLKDKRFLGSMIFYWGTKQEYTHTWFSTFSEDGKPTEVVEAIRDGWNGKPSSHVSPKIKYIMLDNKGAGDSILLMPGSQHLAKLFAEEEADTLDFEYRWEVIPDDWWSFLKKSPRQPEPENGLIEDGSNSVIKFKAPLKEGPYRVFVTVSNGSGYTATANIPFYVVGNP